MKRLMDEIKAYVIIPEGMWVFPIFYLQIITLAELLTVLREARIGLILHGIVMISILIHGGVEQNMLRRRFLLSLALAPLIRLLSLSLPLSGRPLVDWYFWVGALLFVATFIAARILGLNWRRMGLTLKGWPQQILFGFTGIGLGVMEYFILRPEPLVQEFTLQAVLLPAFILIVFTGILEEFIFRGVIQEASLASYSKFGITYGAVLFAVLHVGYNSLLDVIFVFAVAMLFGVFVLKTRSLLGVSIAHSFTNIGLLLVFPFVIGGGPTPSVDAPLPNSTAAPTTVQEFTATASSVFTEIPTADSADLAQTQTFEAVWTETAAPQVIPSETVPPLPTSAPQATSTQCSPPGDWVTYTIQPGDSLSSISRAFGVSLTELQQGNCLSSSIIIAGNQLYVPNVPTITPIPSSTIVPSSTSTLAPISTITNTPVPTLTFTNTPVPTNTFTSTPVPTDTSAP